MQTTSHILMIRPLNFAFNAETAVNNAFQQSQQDDDAVAEKALKEFDDFVGLLRKNEIDVTVVNDTPHPYTPDSIFPNNWISFHEDGTILLYPMFAVNRRKERKPEVLEVVRKKFRIANTIDLSGFEEKDLFLEGTGSMVLDRDHKVAYACLSPRTNKNVLSEFCSKMGYRAVLFDAVDSNGLAIYHTNVLMCIADQYAVICLDAIRNETEQEKLAVVDSLRHRPVRKIIPISLEQMNRFAGNMLQVQNSKGEQLLVMSSQAYNSLSTEQRNQLTSYNPIIHADLVTIETNGGGSARCMMAEIHLPEKVS